jgi:hypothetical protein
VTQCHDENEHHSHDVLDEIPLVLCTRLHSEEDNDENNEINELDSPNFTSRE